MGLVGKILWGLFLLLSIVSSASAVCVGSTQNYSCGETITESCTLNSNLNTTGTCFTIGVDDVLLNGAGYQITGDDGGVDMYIYGVNVTGQNNVSIVYLNVVNFSWGIYLETVRDSNVTGNNITQNYRGIVFMDVNDTVVQENNILSNTWDGLNIWATSVSNIIRNNNIQDNAGDGGIVFSDQGFDPDPTDNQITDNNVMGNNDGIIFWAYCWGSNLCDTGGDNNIVTNNNISNNSGTAINMSCTENFPGYCDSFAISLNLNNNNNITNNTIEENLRGIVLDYATSSDIYENTICNNTLIDIDNSTSDPTAEGVNNSCNNTSGWNDAGATGCTNACGGITTSTTTTSSSSTTTTIGGGATTTICPPNTLCLLDGWNLISYWLTP
ncbi:MAG: right-handed parallel beta-helix repeat-containing protein [Candidatus Altiarchaeota archaeon]